MIGKTNSQSGSSLKGEMLNISLTTNQASHSDIMGAKITVTHPGGTTEYTWQGSVINVEIPAYVPYTVSYAAVTGYTKPGDFSSTAIPGNSQTLTGTYRTTILTVTMTDNQPTLDDVANATASVSANGITTQTVKTGGKVKIPTGTEATVTFNALADYKTPDAVKVPTSGASASASGQYLTSLVNVTLNADNGASVNGAVVTINGKTHTWNGTAITQKVAYGVKYDVSVSALDGFATPAANTGHTAAEASRNLTFTYIASALKVVISSNQGAGDSAISGVKATVKYGSTTLQVGNGQNVNIPANVGVTITFPEVEGYLAPNPISFTHTGGMSEKTGTYKCELLTVNVTADSGTPTGFEVTVSKRETVGVTTKYTRLEYIESTGTQYIDTGFKPNQDTKMELDVAFLSSVGTNVAGVRNSSSDTANRFGIVTFSSGGVFGAFFGTISYAVGVAPDNVIHKFTLNKRLVSIDGKESLLSGSETFTCTYPITLGAWNNGSDGISYNNSKIYGCKIYDAGTLIRDFVPALRSDGIAGLYEVVNDIFYASSGSGNFVAGYKENEVIATQTSVTGTYKIPFDASYTVKASNVNGYTTPSSITRVASNKTYTVTQEYKVITVKDLSLYDIYGNPINRSTANCYVVREAGSYKFPLVFGNAIKNGQVNTAAFTNNGGSYSSDFYGCYGEYYGDVITTPYIEEQYNNVSNVYISNQDVDNIVLNLSIVDGEPCNFAQFDISQIPSTGGNVIISAIANSGEETCWSWHIWLWPHDLSPVEITNATGVKYNIMPVNLASKYDNDGVHIKNWFYQWGRLNPMLCPSAYNSAVDHNPGSIIKYSKARGLAHGIADPSTFFYNPSSPYNWFGDKSYYNLWDAACTGTGNSDNDTVKTVYDPCPVGWKIPNGNTFTGLKIISSANGIVKMARYSGDTVGVGFPMSGYRNRSDGSLNYVGSYGFVWLSSADSQNYAYGLYFNSSNVNPQYNSCRACGYSVRPVQE